MTAAAALFLSGCGAGGGVGGLLGGGTGGCTPTTYTIQFPATVGFSAVGNITAATGCFSTATVNSTSSLGPAVGSAFVGPPGAQTLVYLGVTFSSSEYANGTPSLTVTLPSTVSAVGKHFYLAYNNSGIGSSFGWTSAIAGPVSASGSTVTFSGGSSNTTFTANQEYEFAVYDI